MELLIILSIFLILSGIKPSDKLYCGIFAWTGDSTKKFNWDKFNILGILNNTRGGDSCGIVSGNNVRYGLGVQSDYNEFLEHVDLFPIQERVIIGHTRKASAGYAINEVNTQPVVLRRTQDKEVVFVLAHNGTIYNIDELATKYNVNIGNVSDSLILAHIIYNHGFGVLSEYIGSASLVIYDRRKFLETGDVYTYVYKGMSKSYSTSKDETEERPLFYMSKDGSIYISSIKNSLYAIRSKKVLKKETISAVEPNKVFTLKNGKLFGNPIDIDRSNVTQFKPFKNHQTNLYGDDWDSPYYGGYGYGNNNYHKPVVNSNIDIIRSQNLPVSPTKIDYRRGRYHLATKIVNGIFKISKNGEVSSLDSNNPVYYFIDGILIDGHNKYQEALKLIKKDNLSEEMEGYYRVLVKYSLYPIYRPYVYSKKGYFVSPSAEGYLYAHTGKIKPIFSTYMYEVNKGACVKTDFLLENERIYWFDNNNDYEEDIQKKDCTVGNNTRYLPNIITKVISNNFKDDIGMDNEFYNFYDDEDDDESDISISRFNLILGDLIEAFLTARQELATMGGEYNTKKLELLENNLESIENILVFGSENIYNKQLTLEYLWEDPF